MHSLEFSLQKEEAERSARWEQFLKTYCESTVESLDANESPRKEYYHAREKGESKKFETWNEIRPSLYPVARALQHRFKKKKKDVQANNGSVAGQGEIYQSSSQRESEDESDDELSALMRGLDKDASMDIVGIADLDLSTKKYWTILNCLILPFQNIPSKKAHFSALHHI